MTEETPRAMVRIAGRPILEHILWQLSAHGFKEVVLAVLQRDRRSIDDYFGDGSHFGIKLDYLESDGSRSTAGHIWEMRSSLKEDAFGFSPVGLTR
jgi:mannose-1-phosphate guanylyltransferase/phosphomannomutase